MLDYVKLVSDLERDEGIRLKFYLDSKGIPTIGIGRNLRKGITKAEAYYLCNNDIEEVIGELDHAASWWRRLDNTRQLVLANMCYNMGIARLLGFEKFLGYAFASKFDEAAREMLDSKWAREDVSPERSNRLAEMMRKGDAHVAVVS